MEPLDETDAHILYELQSDGRLSNQELADRVGLSPSPCLRRVRQLQETGVIERYAALVSQAAVGLNITAFVRLTLSSHTEETVDAVQEHLRAVPEIVEAYLLAGDQDYLVKVVVASFEAYEDLLRRELRSVPALTSLQTTFAFSVVKPLSPIVPEAGRRRRRAGRRA